MNITYFEKNIMESLENSFQNMKISRRVTFSDDVKVFNTISNQNNHRNSCIFSLLRNKDDHFFLLVYKVKAKASHFLDTCRKIPEELSMENVDIQMKQREPTVYLFFFCF